MLERFILTLVILAVLWAAWRLWRRYQRERLEPLRPGQLPRILYFSSLSCAACGPQSRFLAQLEQAWAGRLQLVTIDADRQPDQAQSFHVMTLPTTILVDQSGSVRHVNYGLTSAQRLSRQLEEIL